MLGGVGCALSGHAAYPGASISELAALLNECEQSLPGVAQVLAVLSGAEGGDGRDMAPSAVQKQMDQMLPLDLTPSGSFEQELIFGWGKKRACFPLIV